MLNKLNKLKLASIASVALAASGFALPATATDNYGYGYYEGCTPGYWKQYHHEDSWPEVYYEYNYVGYDPYQTVQSVFYAVKDYDLKLIEALKGRGGGEIALLRHAVAGILNAENKFVKYKYTPKQVKEMVNKALKSYNKKYIEKTKDALEDANEQGCPLS